MPTELARPDDTNAMHSDRDRLSLVVEIVEAIALARNVEVDSLQPLAYHVDPEAVARVVESATVATTVTLELYGCTVDIDENGNIEVRRTGDRATEDDELRF